MTLSLSPLRLKLSPVAALALFLVLALIAAALVAQIEGERGVAPVASTGDFQVKDIEVDVYGPDPDSARLAGWRLAQRLAWTRLNRQMNGRGGAMPDSALNNMVSAIEVQSEQIGPNRYIATLTVLFDRARTGQALGVGGQAMRSPPLLVIPVLTQGGVTSTFEYPSEWQRAWALFRTGDSAIDYVRTSGAGADPMLLNAGQTGRRSRLWWRNILDQYGAADVIIPMARIQRLSPDGPVLGSFAARYGPDNQLIGSFSLRVDSPERIPAMMAEAVQRMDQIYTGALYNGVLRPDPSLIIEEPVAPEDLSNETAADSVGESIPADAFRPATQGETSYLIQYDTPTVASVGQVEAQIRAIPGVSSATTTSLALGGTSVLQASFSGTPDELRVALSARGYTVTGRGTTVRIVRRTAPAAAPPPPATGGGTAP